MVTTRQVSISVVSPLHVNELLYMLLIEATCVAHSKIAYTVHAAVDESFSPCARMRSRVKHLYVYLYVYTHTCICVV